MVNKPKNIGTAGETGVKRTAQAYGFPLADRLTLQGSSDRGDLLLAPGCIVEVKAGKAAHDASWLDLDRWLEETRAERLNAGADIALLVIARRGYAPARAGHWRAIFPEPWRLFRPLLSHDERSMVIASEVRRVLASPAEMNLMQALSTLRRAGWGEPLDKVT